MSAEPKSLAERVRLAEDAAHLEDVTLDMILVHRGGSLSVFIAGDDLAEGEKILRRLGATEVRSTTVFGPYVEGMTEALGLVAVYPRMPRRVAPPPGVQS